MSVRSSLHQSIFLRIYAGLLFVCLLVALFANLLISTINAERSQAYRENIATAVMYLVNEGLGRQILPEDRQYWLADASSLFDVKFQVMSVTKADLKSSEIKRIEKSQAVVRLYDEQGYADVFYKAPAADEVLTVQVNKVSEQQIKAVAVLLLDDLSYYPTIEQKQQRLKVLQPHFPFPITLSDESAMELDSDQLARLHRKDIVVVLRDGTSVENSAIKVIAPLKLDTSLVTIGPIKLFNWFPLNLVVSVILISMFLISLGVYALIFPLERKLQLIQVGINRVQKGNLDTKVTVLGEDEISTLASNFNIMTEHIRRLIESQRELTRAVSHELRTPVARIRFGVDMLADTDDEDSRMMQRDYIDQDIEALNLLIDEMLTYAKLEEGSPKLEFEPVNLHDLVAQIVRETNALGKPVTVIADDVDSNAVAWADRRYLHRVLQNLAGNATRYAESKIIVSASIQKNGAMIRVEDDGQGIPEKDREKVFIPFTRLDDSRTRASGGYGLGLSIVSRIAFWFNGEMTVDASPQLGGARFTMTWPVRPIAAAITADTITQQSHGRTLGTDV